jgi:hypothetical protein
LFETANALPPAIDVRLQLDDAQQLIYAQIKGSCALMGQEILEASDPY